MYLLKAANIFKSFNKEKILDKISIRIKPRTFNIILGENGSGKSMFMNILAGLTKPDSGRISCNVNIFHMPQQLEVNLLFPISVSDFVSLGKLSNTKRNISIKDKYDANVCLTSLGIGHIGSKRINEISGGQLKKVLLARGFLSGAGLFLLDEPLCGIDKESCYKTMVYLKDFSIKNGITIIMITHHHEYLNPKIIDELYYMNKGKLSSASCTGNIKILNPCVHKVTELV